MSFASEGIMIRTKTLRSMKLPAVNFAIRNSKNVTMSNVLTEMHGSSHKASRVSVPIVFHNKKVQTLSRGCVEERDCCYPEFSLI